MKKSLLTLLLLVACLSRVFAGVHVYEPEDQQVTFKGELMLRGTGKNLQILKINNVPIGFDREGSFSCGLVLQYGKNYAEVQAQDKDKEHFIKKIRILQLKTYPDIETRYEGKLHWARNQIIFLSTPGFVEGYPDDNFYPSNPVSRGELATWIARLKRLKIPQLEEDVFFDVPKEHWRAPFIKAAVDKGYMKEYPNKIFGIDDPVSRREAAEIALKVEGVELIGKITPLFRDVPKEEKGAAPIYVAGEKGLVVGISKDIPIYDPDRALTRAETVILLSRFSYSVESVKDLFDFEKGYGEKDFTRVNVPPKILAFEIKPDSIKIKEESVIGLRVEIASREAFYPVSKVMVDLSEIGGLPDTELFDDGTHGDEAANDLTYSLNVSLVPRVSGVKFLTVTATDRLGWESRRETSLLILE